MNSLTPRFSFLVLLLALPRRRVLQRRDRIPDARQDLLCAEDRSPQRDEQGEHVRLARAVAPRPNGAPHPRPDYDRGRREISEETEPTSRLERPEDHPDAKRD